MKVGTKYLIKIILKDSKVQYSDVQDHILAIESKGAKVIESPEPNSTLELDKIRSDFYSYYMDWKDIPSEKVLNTAVKKICELKKVPKICSLETFSDSYLWIICSSHYTKRQIKSIYNQYAKIKYELEEN